MVLIKLTLILEHKQYFRHTRLHWTQLRQRSLGNTDNFIDFFKKLLTWIRQSINMKLSTLFGIAFLIGSGWAQNETCPDGQVLCEGTVDECIPEEFMCDGTFIDCSNDADENDCPCPIGFWKCPNSTKCIYESWICDLEPNCPGGEDEGQHCGPCTGFLCNDGTCIPEMAVCDWDNDCADGEDEDQDCPICDGFVCSDRQCIPNEGVCDGYYDCANDEIGCPCTGFECLDNGACIPGSWICDGDLDCNDGSDEANCTLAAVPAVAYKRHSILSGVS